jgi:hypothetical protein
MEVVVCLGILQPFIHLVEDKIPILRVFCYFYAEICRYFNVCTAI